MALNREVEFGELSVSKSFDGSCVFDSFDGISVDSLIRLVVVHLLIHLKYSIGDQIVPSFHEMKQDFYVLQVGNL